MANGDFSLRKNYKSKLLRQTITNRSKHGGEFSVQRNAGTARAAAGTSGPCQLDRNDHAGPERCATTGKNVIFPSFIQSVNL